MKTTWVIAEQRKSAGFRIVKLVSCETEPTEEFRKGIIEILESYKGTRMPNNVACLFQTWDEEGAKLLAEAAPIDVPGIFEELKSAGRTSCNDSVSIQRSAWCYKNGIDVLEYSFQNGGGSKNKSIKIAGNKDFQAFRAEKCEVEDR